MDYLEEIKLYADNIRQAINKELSEIEDGLELVRSGENFRYIANDSIFRKIEERKEYLQQLLVTLDNKVNSYDPTVKFHEEYELLQPLVNGANYDEMFQHLDDMLGKK